MEISNCRSDIFYVAKPEGGNSRNKLHTSLAVGELYVRGAKYIESYP